MRDHDRDILHPHEHRIALSNSHMHHVEAPTGRAQGVTAAAAGNMHMAGGLLLAAVLSVLRTLLRAVLPSSAAGEEQPVSSLWCIL